MRVGTGFRSSWYRLQVQLPLQHLHTAKKTYAHNWRAFETLSHRRSPTQDVPVLERRASSQDRNLIMRGAPVDQETNLHTGGMDIS
jgi:hypothetical protein